MKKGIISIVSLLVGMIAGASIMGKTMYKSLTKTSNMSDKHLTLFLMMNQWVRIKQEGKNIFEYFEKNEYKRIAVYGMSYAGETLLEELNGTNIEVVYGIDRNAKSIYLDIDMKTLEDELEEVDAVVVTAITFYDEIKEKLEKVLTCPLISLEDILYDV